MIFMNLKYFTDLLNTVLAPGGAVFMPFIILLFVWVIKLYQKDSITWFQGIRSAMLLGVAFISMGIVIGFAVNTFATPFQQLKRFVDLNTLDLGWPPAAALSWSWPFAILLFPVQIFTNAIMLKFKWTKTLNADMWNVWHKVFTALVVAFLLTPAIGSQLAVIAGIFVGWISIIFELKNADALYERQYAVTGIPNVNSPHSMFMAAPVLHFVDKFLQKIPYFQDKPAPEQTQKSDSIWVKILRENMFSGFIIGLLIAGVVFWIDRGNWVSYVQLPFKMAAALVLFPMAARLFTESLVPIGAAIQKITQAKFKDREIYIGLDWPIFAGSPKLWLVTTMIIPTTLLMSIGLSFIPGMRAAFPIGSLINLCLVAPALVICRQNVRRMYATSVILTPMWLLFGSFVAPALTNLAVQNTDILGGVGAETISQLKDGSLHITSLMFETPDFRFALIASALAFSGTFTPVALAGVGWFAIWLILFKMYYAETKKEAAILRAERLRKEG